jgi:ABC-2 type transport system permease protein
VDVREHRHRGVHASIIRQVVAPFDSVDQDRQAGLSWIAAVIGLLGQSVEVVQQLAALVIIPVFLSNALVPTATMPSWLRVIVANQPLSQAIDCIRAFLAGTPVGDHLGLALGELAGIIAGAIAAETMLFKRKTAR